MRRVSATSCLVAALGSVMALGACSAPESREPPSQPASPSGQVRLQLTADGPDGALKLVGTARDRKYVGIYPNPERWSAIEYTLGDDLVPVVRCTREGVVKACSETPFFVEIARVARRASSADLGLRTYTPPGTPVPPAAETPEESAGDEESGGGTAMPPPTPPEPASGSGGGVTARVIDVHGTEVASKTVESGGTSDGAGTPPSGAPPAGSTCGGATAEGSPGRGGFSKNGQAQACEAASLEDTPGCDASTVAAAAKVYCDAVNAQLPAEDKIDCGVLTSSSYVPSALPTTRAGGDCSTYWEPAREAVSGQASCAKVKLLLTQWRDRARHELIANGVCRSSPLVLDLNGDGVHLSSLRDGVAFDLLGTGQKVLSAWTDGNDALLALDRNGNGEIDGASELFGNATAGADHADGFAALAELDDDGNGVIDAKDRAFGHLLLWRDGDRDGQSRPSELTTLRESGVRRLAVNATRREGASSLDPHGNAIPLAAEFERTDGTRSALVDAFLRYRPLSRR